MPDPTTSISVVIPLHNGAAFIAEAIESVLGQTHPALEIIVIDDGSRDEGPAVARRYGAPVRVHSQVRKGMAGARNAGIALASGRHVAFLDADDVWLPDKIARQTVAMQAMHARAVVSGFKRTDAALRVSDEVLGHIDDSLRGLLSFRYAMAASSTLLADRALLNDLGGFDERLSISADWHLVARILIVEAVAVVPEPLVLYRQHGASLHGNVRGMERDMLLALRDILDDPRLDPAIKREEKRFRSILHRILSGSYYRTGRPWRAVKHGVISVLLDPTSAPSLARKSVVARRRGSSETSAAPWL